MFSVIFLVWFPLYLSFFDFANLHKSINGYLPVNLKSFAFISANSLPHFFFLFLCNSHYRYIRIFKHVLHDFYALLFFLSLHTFLHFLLTSLSVYKTCVFLLAVCCSIHPFSSKFQILYFSVIECFSVFICFNILLKSLSLYLFFYIYSLFS